MTRTPNPILTIGPPARPLNRFIAVLAQHGVTAVADIRSAPHSRLIPSPSERDSRGGFPDAGGI